MFLTLALESIFCFRVTIARIFIIWPFIPDHDINIGNLRGRDPFHFQEISKRIQSEENNLDIGLISGKRVIQSSVEISSQS